MSSTITTSVVTGGSNSHATTSAEVNAVATDFISQGVTGPIVLNSGSGGTGSFAVNAQGTPAMFVDLSAGSAYITATPSGQSSQKLRATMTATYTSYAISSNSSGSTKYDWIYLQVDATAANNPASAADDVTSVYTSRSSSNSTDNGSPPTYGVLLAVVTVANGASSITNSNISDKRVVSTFRSSPATSAVNQVDVASSATGSAVTISAVGTDSNISLNLVSKGAGTIQFNGIDTWTSYTPTIATGSLGNGTITGKYIQIGKTVFFRIYFVLGSTSTAPSGTTFTTPSTISSTAYPTTKSTSGVADFYDSSAPASYAALWRFESTTTIRVFYYNGTNGATTGSPPVTPATSDSFYIQGFYEAA